MTLIQGAINVREIAGVLTHRVKRYANLTGLKTVLRDVVGVKPSNISDELHLSMTIEWLCRAQDATGCGAVSAGYYVGNGWLESYPETTGYIMPTVLLYSSYAGKEEFINRAIKMGDWEIGIQMESGAVRGGFGVQGQPIVFNTGQVIQGWMALYQITKEERFLVAAINAAAWLADIQDIDGKWTRFTYNGIPHAYNTRVAWPMFEVSEYCNDDKIKRAAQKNIEWTLGLADNDGWFQYMGFTENESPLTHTIAYTLQGLLESVPYVEEILKVRLIAVVSAAVKNIIDKVNVLNEDGYVLAARFSRGWKDDAKYTCLVGNVQLAIVMMKLYEYTGDKRLLDTAFRLTDHAKATHNLKSTNLGIRGGIAGSYPIWGQYMSYTYPNWAAKFFADALLMKHEITKYVQM